MTPNAKYHPWQFRVAVLTALFTLMLISVGASVTSLDAGLAYAQAPLSNGAMINPSGWWAQVHTRVEHGHRLIGWLVGMCCIGQCFLASRNRANRIPYILAFAGLFAVVVQGIMGILRVNEISLGWAMAHGIWGQVCFSILVCAAVTCSRWWLGIKPGAVTHAGQLRRTSMAAVILLLGQLTAGVYTRQIAAGFSFHLAGAFIVTAVLCYLLLLLSGSFPTAPWVKRPAGVIGGLLALQFTLGMVTFLVTGGSSSLVQSPSLTQWLFPSMHVVVGALLLSSVIVTLVAVYLFVEIQDSCHPLTQELPA